MVNEKLKKLLCQGIVRIEFEKADGTIREMDATLDTSFIPVHMFVEGAERNTRSSEEVQVVWDVEKEDWRAFRWDRLKGYSV